MVEHFQRVPARKACLTKDEQSSQITKRANIYCSLRIRSPLIVVLSIPCTANIRFRSIISAIFIEQWLYDFHSTVTVLTNTGITCPLGLMPFTAPMVPSWNFNTLFLNTVTRALITFSRGNTYMNHEAEITIKLTSYDHFTRAIETRFHSYMKTFTGEF